MKQVLITGASGLIGSRLTQMLIEKGFGVLHLTRNPNAGTGEVKQYAWNVEKGTIDSAALENAHAIVHLAGAGIAAHRWTPHYRRQIIESRTQSAALLIQALQNNPAHKVEVFVGASAIGYYGNRNSQLLTETDAPQKGDFLSETTQLWETAYAPLTDQLNIRTAILRIGIVLSAQGGALPQTDLPLRMGAPGVYFGNGSQYYSWIHIDDLCRMFIAAIENSQMSGVYNAVAPQPVTNKEFVLTIAKTLGRWAIALPVPRAALHLAMGQMADIVLHSARVSAQKITTAGFTFSYPELPAALAQIYGKTSE
ncbi:TIGR01777 family protein [Sphingobacteriales bacterium UPWRP_1]|nr:TIGR01777 family protein [Sphingobacteriales bacterium TSM_CSS]PSJ74691.1 TIGR01777 family protein [Sphingobacteriales bacterium UPWRP_1]